MLDPEIGRVGESRHPAGHSGEQERKVGGSRRDLKQVQGDDSNEMRGAFDRASFEGRQEVSTGTTGRLADEPPDSRMASHKLLHS
jgi:hypothetical protein